MINDEQFIYYNEQIIKMNSLLVQILGCQLIEMGIVSGYSSDDRIRDEKVKNLYKRWLDESVDILKRNNFYNLSVASAEEAWQEWERQKPAWLDNPNLHSQVILVEATLRMLPEILTGKKLATDVMFPKGSMRLVEGIYKHNVVADYFNEILTNTLLEKIQAKVRSDPTVNLRILEIGAGTGGTSAMILKKFAAFEPYIQEYCYTDISKAFLKHGEIHYESSYPYLTFRVLNIENSVSEQGFDVGSFDIVIAANVLHATKNIRKTVRHAKALLKRNGLIVLNEITDSSLFTHLTFGLLEGWWKYEDVKLRIPGCPGLYPNQWRKVLEIEGFENVFYPAQEARDLGQQIIVAESDGIIHVKSNLHPKQVFGKESKQTLNANFEAVPTAMHPDIRIDDHMMESHVKETIRQKISETLKVDQNVIDNDESYSDYGIDSITGVQLVQSINRALQIELESTDIYDYSSVNQLAGYILAQYKSKISDGLEKNFNNSANPAPHSSTEHASDRVGYVRNVSLQNSSGKVQENGCNKEPLEQNGIAIIGMSGRFAKSDNVNQLWNHLSKGKDLIQEVSRWGIQRQDAQGSSYCKYGSFVEGIDQFDPRFFNITGLEATYMDPQHRIFLEESWRAIEDSGYAGQGIQSKLCGVYVGCGPSDYDKLIGDSPPAQAFWGNASSIIPARISYYLDLQGPAIAVDTACSSSLVSIHLACQALKTNEIDMALAGGIFIQSTPNFYHASSRAGMLSSTGRCHAFDDKADGFVPGEGAGVVVLKRLADALADGDHIYGIIRGTAINQDGFTNGITAPSAKSQERLEQSVYEACGISPEQLQMVEAHGTGTQLGDPIEFKALTRVFQKYTDKKNYCVLGTIKANIGHTQYASGVTGLIKILLSLKHERFVPSPNFTKPNSKIDLENSPFLINTALKEWPASSNRKRYAAISSFGFSGTNAHMVIEEAPSLEKSEHKKPGYLIVLSARTKEQLNQQVRQFINYCKEEADVNCGDISYTLLSGRKHLEHRLACVVRDQNELAAVLSKWLATGSGPLVRSSGMQISKSPKTELEAYGNDCIRNCLSEKNENQYYDFLLAIAELYVQKLDLKFEMLFSDEKYYKLSLPTYPFAKESYWVSHENEKSTINSVATPQKLEPTTAPVRNRFTYLTKQWKSSPKSGRKLRNGRIAILATDDTIQLATTIMPLIPGSFILHEKSLEIYLQLPDHQWRDYAGCIDLAGCGREESVEIQWIPWLQKLIEYGDRENLMLLCVTRGLEAFQNQKIKLTGASRVGLYRLLQSEYSHVRSRHMDGELHTDDELLAAQIAAEFLLDSEETEICYRGGKRYLAFLQKSQEHERAEKANLRFPSNHVLWVTGGTRGVGLLCAQHFAAKYGVRKFVMSGRERIPSREEWGLHKDQHTSIGKKIRSILELEKLGAEVMVLSVDLADAQAMSASVTNVKRKMGPIGGVLHCAGMADLENVAFIRKSPEVIKQVLNPKVLGLEMMYQSFINEPLQFFVLFSSVSAIIPTLGSGISDYAMANAYMDYFAESRSDACPLVSIQWASWREVGIGEVTTKAYKQTGMLSMSNEEGLDALDHILAVQKHVTVLPALVDGELWEPEQLMNRKITVNEPFEFFDRLSRSNDTEVYENQLLNNTQNWLISLFSKELRIDSSDIQPDMEFQQYGMDSILLAQVIARMDVELGNAALDPSIILEYPTMNSLSAYLVQSYADSLDSLFMNDIPIRQERKEADVKPQENSTPRAMDEAPLMDQTQEWLISLFSKELRMDASEFELETEFQHYGMDSILLAQVIARMDVEMGGVSLDPSIILEYPTMNSLSGYLTEHYGDVLGRLFSEYDAEHEQPQLASPHEQTLTEKKEEKYMLDKYPEENAYRPNMKIAVIGVDCQFPDALNKNEYWANLKAGRDSIREAPTSRWRVSREYYVGNKKVSKVGGFLPNVEDFDPEYFNISESLAVQIDPLQRKVLECGAGAIADAGYRKEDLWNKQIGVFVGARTSKFYQKIGGSDKDTIVGIGQNFIAAHLSHIYNLKGPNMIVDTACSSSLTALHMAAKSILYGECEAALAGGVDIILDESIYELLSNANIISPDGRSKAFSANADGIGVGEGCGMVMLKPLEQAILDNNKIYAVIDGSAINNDGNTMGITTPNPEAQRELIEKSIADAKIDPETISYVETHGTGTLIGDPIELRALTQVFSKYTDKKQFCGVGSVKSNIGHLVSAAGIASFIKVLLALVHKELPATLHCETPNPRFKFNESPFYIIQDTTTWVTDSRFLRAGISSFGLGGNNAHVIVSNEGIPATHQALLHPYDRGIEFKRKRYWPDAIAEAEAPRVSKHGNETYVKNKEVLAFFEAVEVTEGGCV